MANGLITSNVTGEDIAPGYDYGSITDRDKKLIEEVISILRSRNNLPTDMIISEVKSRFELEEIPMMRIEDTLWHQLTKDEPIGPSIQGFRISIDNDGNKIKVPHIGFSADLDFLDGFLNRLVQKVNNLK
jgi:hypothetical protein